MKKIIAMLLAVIMLAGCSSGVPQEEYDKLKSEYDTVVLERDKLSEAIGLSTETVKANIGEYKWANYKKYNSFASENGLDEDRIYVVGKFSEVKILENLVYTYIRQSDDYEWLLAIGEASKYDVDVEKFTSQFQSKEITVCGIYAGYSAKEQRPGLAFEKIICDGKEYLNLEFITEKGKLSPVDSSKPADTTVGHPNYQAGSSESGTDKSNISLEQTTGQKNALDKAKSYLKTSAFSYEGLISQLEYSKFSHEDATYAAEKCDANWNEQALKKAMSYLKTSAFSYTGLIAQLEYNKFTNEQAIYGADNCEANWNEQAAQKAASYLRTSSFSREGLIGQLEYNGFTYEQAVYGVEQNGY